MNALEKNLASARGEALAANLLAVSTLQALIANISNREEVLAGITAFINESLDIAGPAKGDAHDELNTQMREYARFQAMQALDHITTLVRSHPKQG